MSDIKPDQHEEHNERKSRPPYCLSEDKKKDGFKAKWTGQCYCGNVQVSARRLHQRPSCKGRKRLAISIDTDARTVSATYSTRSIKTR